MEKQKKKKLASEYKKVFEESVVGVLVESQGLTAVEGTQIRKELSKAGYSMKTLKNRVAKISAKGTPFEDISENFVNMRAFIYSNSDDSIELIKTAVKFAKNIEVFNLNSGLMKSGKQFSVFSASELEQLSKLPNKEELIAKFLFLLNSPVTNFIRTLNEIPVGFLRTLQAIADQKN